MNWDNKVAGCELCEQVGGELIWQNEQLRVILVDDPLFVGFIRAAREMKAGGKLLKEARA